MDEVKRYSVQEILADPVRRRKLLARALKSTQAMEGREMTWERAYEVVDQVAKEKRKKR